MIKIWYYINYPYYYRVGLILLLQKIPYTKILHNLTKSIYEISKKKILHLSCQAS